MTRNRMDQIWMSLRAITKKGLKEDSRAPTGRARPQAVTVEKKMDIDPTGNRTLNSRVTVEDTNHRPTESSPGEI